MQLRREMASGLALAAHPEIVLDDDEGAPLRDARQRAGQILNRLCDARRREDQQLGLHERWAIVERNDRGDFEQETLLPPAPGDSFFIPNP